MGHIPTDWSAAKDEMAARKAARRIRRSAHKGGVKIPGGATVCPTRPLRRIHRLVPRLSRSNARIEIMARMSAARRQPVEYFMLQNPRPEGPSLGSYAGCPIPATMVDLFGKRYAYAGVAPRL